MLENKAIELYSFLKGLVKECYIQEKD